MKRKIILLLSSLCLMSCSVLNNSNSELLEKISQLESHAKQDKDKIDELTQEVSDLKEQIDELTEEDKETYPTEWIMSNYFRGEEVPLLRNYRKLTQTIFELVFTDGHSYNVSDSSETVIGGTKYLVACTYVSDITFIRYFEEDYLNVADFMEISWTPSDILKFDNLTSTSEESVISFVNNDNNYKDLKSSVDSSGCKTSVFISRFYLWALFFVSVNAGTGSYDYENTISFELNPWKHFFTFEYKGFDIDNYISTR